jgi:hypothetical protein
MYTYCDHLVSDLHKDAFGFRPSDDWRQWWSSASPDDKQAEWDSLLGSLARTVRIESEREQEGIRCFEASVASVMDVCHCDRAAAVLYLMDADGTDDVGYFEYLNNLPYGYINSVR